MFIALFLPLLITVSGLWMLICLRGGFFLHPIKAGKCVALALERKGAKKSLALALAGTLGVGNIIGVAVGISVGGAGSVPWMLISCLFSSVLKFSEASLACSMCRCETGGMMYIIRKTFSGAGKCLSLVYAFLCLLLGWFMGSALQVSSAVECVEIATQIPLMCFFAIFVICFLFVIAKGIMSIEKFTVVVIPTATVLYICLAFWCLGLNFYKIPSITDAMIREAFSLGGAGGGIAGFLSSKVITEGYSRGLLSNEAGAGTSTIAHARNSNSEPYEVGMLGVCEVVFDTLVLCLITAFAILVSVDEPQSFESGVELIMASIGSSFGGKATFLVILCIVAFSFSTVVCWYYYGMECYCYIFKRKAGALYVIAFLLSIILGFFLKVERFVVISDYILLLLTFISCITVIKNSGKVKNHAGDMLAYTLASIPKEASFDSSDK